MLGGGCAVWCIPVRDFAYPVCVTADLGVTVAHWHVLTLCFGITVAPVLGLLGVSGATVSTNASSRPIAVTFKTKALAARDKLLVYATVVSGK